MLPSVQPSASVWPHRWAVLLVCVTFPLIWIGGLVTTYKAGMAVPDWPNTYGYNLFLYPWQTWINGPWDLFIEHGHRLWGATVGMVTIGLVVSVWWNDTRRWMRICSLAALAAVIFQGLLGGMRVRMDEILLARIHGCFGPAFFAFATALAVWTSAWWRAADGALQTPKISGRLARLAGTTALLVYVQLVLGSLLRHVPSGTGPMAFRMAVWAHLLMAAVVSVHVILLAIKSWRSHLGNGLLIRPVYGLVGLLIAQVSLGVGTWVLKYGWPAWFANSSVVNSSWLSGGSWLGLTVTAGSRLQAWVTTLHVAIGSLILAVAVMTTLRMARAACQTGGVSDAASSQAILAAQACVNAGLDLKQRSGGERSVAERQVLEAVA